MKSEPSYSGLSAISINTILKCSFGVAVLGGKICPLIERGEQLPCKKSKLFTTTEDDQQMISTAIYEGEGDFQRNCRLIKTIKFDGIKKAKKGVPRIEITFDVDVNTNKTEVKVAVEKMFDVKVEKVNIMNVKPKTKRMGRYVGKTKRRKKAIVKLKEGYSI